MNSFSIFHNDLYFGNKIYISLYMIDDYQKKHLEEINL